jgi:hypothetical protein
MSDSFHAITVEEGHPGGGKLIFNGKQICGGRSGELLVQGNTGTRKATDIIQFQKRHGSLSLWSVTITLHKSLSLDKLRRW